MSYEPYQNIRKKRVVWSDNCVHELLNVFEDQQIIQRLDGSRYRNEDVFRMAAAELNRRHNGENTFTVPEIRVKWKSLKKMFKDAKVKNEFSGHNKVTCKYYDRLDELLGHGAISNTKNTGGVSSFVVDDDTNNIQNLEENHLKEMSSTIEDNFSTYTDSICSQSIVILQEKKAPPRYSECETEWTNPPRRQNYLNTSVKVQSVEDSPELLFLKSLIPDFKKLNNKNQRRFKHAVLSTLDLLHDEQEI